MTDVTKIPALMMEHHASDLFFSPKSPISIKINGITRPLSSDQLERVAAKS